MTFPFGSYWGREPSPELLAAYLDGEFEGRDELAELKARLEAWITAHPHVCEEIGRQRRLRQVWAQTTPPEPAARQWRQAWDNILAQTTCPTSTAASGRSWVGWLAASAALACAALLAWYLLAPLEPWLERRTAVSIPSVMSDYRQPVPDDEPFTVARSHEVVVWQVAGADTVSLPIGQLPVHDVLQLVGRNDVAIASPHARIVFGLSSPMVWERLGDDEP